MDLLNDHARRRTEIAAGAEDNIRGQSRYQIGIFFQPGGRVGVGVACYFHNIPPFTSSFTVKDIICKQSKYIWNTRDLQSAIVV
jgi:hypothetical protein